jgi:two-component system, cell cycle sensor histidine kinase and response regulator CckA
MRKSGPQFGEPDEGGTDSSYKVLFHRNPHPMWVYDTQSLAFLAVNDAAIEHYGYSRQEFLKMTIRDIRPGTELPGLTEYLAAAPHEVRRKLSVIHRKKDGSLIDVEVTSCAVDFHGRSARLVLADDVSARKLAERELGEKASELKAIFDALPDLCFLLDEEGRIRDYRVGRENDLHAGPEEVMGRSMLDVLPEEAGRKFEWAVQQVGLHGRPIQIEYSLPMPQGNLDFEARLLPMLGKRIIVIVRNITKEKAAEEALRRSNETLQAIIEASPLAIIGLDLNGNVRTWNRAAQSMFGWTEAEVAGKPLAIVPADDWEFFIGNVERAKSGATVAGIERKRLRKDGTLIDVSLWNAVQRDASGKTIGVISVIADIRERKQLEAQLRQSQKMEAVGRLAGGVAHDFNNLLTVVTGYSQMLLDKLKPNDPVREDIEEILKAGNRAAGLTSQLLAFGRRQIIQTQVLDLNRVISNFESMLRRFIVEDIELTTDLASDLGPIRADPGQVEQVLMNLTINARDAMTAGGKLVIATSNYDYTGKERNLDLKPGWYVRLTVSDTGAGMNQETQSRLFEPFFTTKELGKGTGLGLSTVYGIVKQHGGDIELSSAPGEGTTFHVYFPRTAGPLRSIETAVEQVPVGKGCGTVLLVEDEEAVRKLTRDMLVKQGYEVVDACDGVDALRVYALRAKPVDLLLTDVVMPKMGGPELAEKLSALQPGIKVIYLSGYTERVIGEHGILGGSKTVLIKKPFSSAELSGKIREVLQVK